MYVEKEREREITTGRERQRENVYLGEVEE